MIPLELSPFLRLNPALPKRALQNGELSRMANIFIHAGSVIQAYGWDPLINTPVFTLRTWSNYAVGEKWNNTVNTWLNQGSVGGIIRHIQEHIDTAGNTYV